MEKNSVIKVGDVLTSLRAGEGIQSCKVIKVPPPHTAGKVIVAYESGFRRSWSKNHLRKYYKKQNENS